MTGSAHATDVAIVGAGFSGTLLSFHLAKAGVDCMLIGDAATFHRGRAYSTVYPEHLLNVPVSGMSALPDEPEHFRHWMAAIGLTAEGADFAPRLIYGRYLSAIGAQSGANILKDWVLSARPAVDGWQLDLETGLSVSAARIVLATGHRVPRLPGALAKLGTSMISDPYRQGALDAVPPDARLVVIGTGLTAVDAIATLHERGHRGPITAVSRHGRWPAGHKPPGDRHLLRRQPRPVASDYVAWLREEIERAKGAGHDWRCVVDAVRADAQWLWTRLPPDAQRRLLRHGRNLWDTARHQMPPQAEIRLDRLHASGQLRSVAGRLTGAELKDGGFEVEVATRGGGAAAIACDAIVLCIGTESAPRPGGSHLLDRLCAAGQVSSDRHGLGIVTDGHGRCLDAAGQAVSGLYAMGPLRRGTLWENIAVPELRSEAVALARHLAGDGSAADQRSGAPRVNSSSKNAP